MAVPEGPDSEEAEAARQYIAYHEKVPHAWRLSDIEEFKKTLLDRESSLEQKKRSLVILAHIGRPDVLATLEEYARHPDEELRIWINMALQECESFLKSDILDTKYKHCHGRG